MTTASTEPAPRAGRGCRWRRRGRTAAGSGRARVRRRVWEARGTVRDCTALAQRSQCCTASVTGACRTGLGRSGGQRGHGRRPRTVRARPTPCGSGDARGFRSRRPFLPRKRPRACWRRRGTDRPRTRTTASRTPECERRSSNLFPSLPNLASPVPEPIRGSSQLGRRAISDRAALSERGTSYTAGVRSTRTHVCTRQAIDEVGSNFSELDVELDRASRVRRARSGCSDRPSAPRRSTACARSRLPAWSSSVARFV